MAKCWQLDRQAGPADSRIAAYLDCQHHPQHALGPRIAYLAVAGDAVVAYVAGHLTQRHGCDGEVQYLYVAPAYRRKGIGSALLRLLADWFLSQGACKMCVAVANDNPPEARPFVESVGASLFKKHWHAWDNVDVVPRATSSHCEAY
jgi:GNAT superfamily N-acetyltransferase